MTGDRQDLTLSGAAFQEHGPDPKLATPYTAYKSGKLILTLGISLFIRHCQDFFLVSRISGPHATELLSRHTVALPPLLYLFTVSQQNRTTPHTLILRVAPVVGARVVLGGVAFEVAL